MSNKPGRPSHTVKWGPHGSLKINVGKDQDVFTCTANSNGVLSSVGSGNAGKTFTVICNETGVKK